MKNILGHTAIFYTSISNSRNGNAISCQITGRDFGSPNGSNNFEI